MMVPLKGWSASLPDLKNVAFAVALGLSLHCSARDVHQTNQIWPRSRSASLDLRYRIQWGIRLGGHAKIL